MFLCVTLTSACCLLQSQDCNGGGFEMANWGRIVSLQKIEMKIKNVQEISGPLIP